ncbi:hypothetical protein GCM10022630_33050 [Thermobifida alba]
MLIVRNMDEPHGAGPEPSGPGGDGASPTGPSGAAPPDYARLTAYTYLTVPERADYIAVMRVFTGTLLADLSAHEVAEKLAHSGDPKPVDLVALRLDQLRAWGALLPSARPVRAATVTEYQRSRGRYQLSPAGEMVQRHSDELLAADSVREVSRELLGLVAEGLTALRDLAQEPGGVAGQDALGRVSTIFAQFERFVESVREFYAYLGHVLNRFDLGDTEFRVFKDVLLDYAETITEDVARQTPVIREALDGLWPVLPDLLARIDAADQGLSALGDSDVRIRRSSGRHLRDWQELRGWFIDSGGRGSGVGQLRLATMKALQSLLGNAKRMLRSSAMGELSRRNDLLRLARWVDAADDSQAHDLVAAAFGMYGVRHLGGARGDRDTATSSTSWWHDDPVDVPVSIRERGDRRPRGAVRREGEDYTQARRDLLRTAREREERRAAGAAELVAAAGREDTVVFSAAAFELFNELLGRAMAQPSGEPGSRVFRTADAGLRLSLEVREQADRTTVVHSRGGDLVLEGCTVHLSSSRTREATGS